MLDNPIELLMRLVPASSTFYLIEKNISTGRVHHSDCTKNSLSEAYPVFVDNAYRRKRCSYISLASYIKKTKQFRSEAIFDCAKAFFIDIDCDKHADKKAVITTFKDTTGLTPFSVIDSGNGLHISILTDTEMQVDVYRDLNRLLQHTLAQVVLPLATIDAQPITAMMRLPGTYNHKTNEAKPVYIREYNDYTYTLQDLEQALVGLVERLGYTPTENAHTRVYSGGGGRDAKLEPQEGNIYGEITGLKASDVLAACHQITQQAVAKEVDWVNMIATLLPLDGAYNTIHMLSSKHTSYDKTECDNKIQAQVQIGASPRKCSTFATTRLAICESCQYFTVQNADGTTISPILFAYRARERRTLLQNRPIQALPSILSEVVELEQSTNLESPTKLDTVFTHDTFKLDLNKDSPSFGVISIETIKSGKNQIEKEEQLYDFIPIKGVQLRTDMVRGAYPISFQITFEDRIGKQYVVELSAGECSGTKYVEALNNVGITYKAGKRLTCMTFLEALVDYYRATTVPVEATEKLGFDLKKTSFTLGNKVYTARGATLVQPRGALAQYMVDTSASGKPDAIEVWKEAVAMYSPAGMEWCQAVICASIAAPLITFLGLDGSCAVSLYGESGNGKSTLQRLCTAIWGQPQRLLATGNDTELAGFLKMGFLNSIPLHFDEMTTVNVKKLGTFAYQVTQGRPKDASTDKGGLRHNPYRFSSLVTLSTNKSIQNALANDKDSNSAQRRRIVELHTTPVAHLSKYGNTEVNVLIGKLTTRYGDVGHMLAKKYMDDLDFYESRIQKIATKIDKEAKEYGYTSADRFLTPFLVLAMLGCEIGVELGLFTFDKEAIKKYIISELVRVSSSISQDDRVTVKGTEFSEFISENIDACIILNAPTLNIYQEVKGLQTTSPSPLTDAVFIHTLPKGKIVVRSARKVVVKSDFVGERFIHTLPTKRFKTFCAENGYDYQLLLTRFQKQGGIVITKQCDLLEGTSRSTGLKTNCLIIDFNE